MIHIDGPADIATAIADATATYLDEGRRVTWFLSGGSAIEVAVNMRGMLGSLRPDQLNVCLVDERYGEPGHSASNWQQLIMAGFEFTETKPYPMLTPHTDIEDTCEDYNSVVAHQLEKGNVSIGLFGVGEDGHTAGLLPHNPVMDSVKYVDAYETADYKRISLTPKAIHAMGEIFVYAVGSKKWPALAQMFAQGTVADIPSRIFNDSDSVYLYTDYEGDPK